MFLIQKLLIFLLGAYFSISVVIDVMIIPTVFRVIENKHLAGLVGRSVFQKFNWLEIFLCLILLLLTYLFAKNRYSWWPFICASICLIIALLFKFYLTPQIMKYSLITMQEVPGSLLHTEATNMRFLFHLWYKRIEAVKLIVLLVMTGFIFILKKREVKIFT